MKKIRLFGENAQLTPIAKMIMEEDIAGLEASLSKEWTLNKPFEMTKYINELAITLALVENKINVIDYLLEKKANLNHSKSPSIVTAACSCSINTLEKLLASGAMLDAVDAVGKNAYSAALYSQRFDLIEYLFNKGLEVDGVILRQAAFHRQIEAVSFFLAKGVDPNLRKADMVFPYNPTAITIAARNDDLAMVELLLAHGADVTLSDDYGNRPYLCAIKNNNKALAALLKAREPSDWHDINKRIEQFKSWGMPENMVTFLSGEDKKLSINNEDVSWLVFADICHTKEVTFDNKLYIDLAKDIDNYDASGFLTWSVSEKMLVHLDYEHKEIVPLGHWDDFIENLTEHINKIFP